MHLTEHGVATTPGGENDMDTDLAPKGIDQILEFAIEVPNRAAEDKEEPTRTLARHQ